MLRKLKQQVAQAVNNVNSQQPQHEPLYNENDDTSPQGFLCPICMQSHTSPDQLKAHFQVHAVQQISKIGDCEISSSTSSELIGNGFDGPKEGHLETDTKEIESQLLDEKCYSAELRKELDGLHNIIAKQEELSEDEVPYFTQQLHLLQAGKALAAERMLEMEKSIKTMSRHIQQLKQEKIVLIKKIGELSKDYAGKINEVEEKNQEKTLLGDELVRYRQEMQNLEAQTEILQTKLDHRPSEDDVSVLRKELVHAQQLMDTITQKKESEIKKYIDTIHNTERDCKKLAYEVENLKNNVEQFKNNIITFQVRAKQFLEEFSTSANVWEEKALAANEKIDCVSSKIDSIQCIVRKYQNKISNNICDKVELTKQLENCDKAVEMMAGKEEAIKKYKEEIQQLKEHISKQQKLLEKAAATENVLKLNLKNAETKESSLMKKISEGFGAEKVMIEKMQHEKLFLERTVSELNKKLTSLKCRYEETISNQNKNWETKLSIEREAVKNLKTKLHESSLKFYSFKEENEKLMKMLEGKDETMKEMEEIIEKGKAEFHSAIEKLATMEEKAKQLINELHEKNAALFRRDERCAELEETVMTMKLEMDNLKKAKRQLECNLAQKKHDEKYIQELQSTLSECEKDKIALNESIEALKQRYLKLDVDCARYRDCVVAMEKNLSEKETIMKELKTSLEVSEHFTDVAANYKKQLSVVSKELITLKNENCIELKAQKEMFSELNEELSMKKKDFSEVTKKMEHLREQLLLEKEEKSALEDEISKLNKHNLKLQEELSIQEKKTSDMQNSFEKELSFLKHSLQECKKKEEGTLSLLNTQLKEEEDKLKNALKDVEMKDADLERMKKDLANITKECDELRIHQSELEKATAEWLQERRALQERCISAESDLEFERERAAVNKKNFDDIQTAVRELGRVNQNLQMDFAKQASRKWLDDSEARNCHACNKPFTLTNRKHHCRECGQIFCSSCSSFSAKIASHKNPVRVCSACYEEITHRN